MSIKSCGPHTHELWIRYKHPFRTPVGPPATFWENWAQIKPYLKCATHILDPRCVPLRPHNEWLANEWSLDQT